MAEPPHQLPQQSSCSMASPTRTTTTPPPPAAAVEPVAPSSPSPEHPPVKPSSDGSLSPENPAPAPPPPPPPPPATPPPDTPSDSSPSSTPHPSAPQSPPPPPPPLPPSADASPPLRQQGQASPPRPQAPPSPAPVSPPTPAPASSEAKSEQDAAEAESASESGSMTLAVVLAQTEDSTPQKASSAEASPAGSPQKESAVTIAKLLSGEAPVAAAAEGKATPDKVTLPPSDTGSLAAAAAVTPVGGGGVGGGVGSKRWLLGGVPEKVRRAELRRAELGFRVSAAVFCLVALSVMAADTTTGWSGDSFRRYNEYRYVLAASVMAFTYSGFQLAAEAHYLVTGRRIIRAPFRGYFNLAMDQMFAYLLLSASSAALSRNGVWMSRFGGDQFTKLINASASMAFLAFIALGLNSVISAYCVFSLLS